MWWHAINDHHHVVFVYHCEWSGYDLLSRAPVLWLCWPSSGHWVLTVRPSAGNDDNAITKTPCKKITQLVNTDWWWYDHWGEVSASVVWGCWCWDGGDDVFFTLITTWLGPPDSAQLRARIQLWPLSEPNTRVLMSLPPSIGSSQNQRDNFRKSLFYRVLCNEQFFFY